MKTSRQNPMLAKAWVKFTAGGGTPTIADSFNVSSITDDGVGDHTVNFTVAFDSANYTYAGFANRPSVTSPGVVGGYDTATHLAGSCRHTFYHLSGSAQDMDAAGIVYFGDQ